MHAITTGELCQRRVLSCERHERHLHDPGPRNGVHGQTDTVNRDRAVQNRRFGNPGRHSNVDKQGIAVLRDLVDGPDAVHVPLDDMTAHEVSRPQRPFKIDRAAFFPFADQGAPKGRRNRMNRETALPDPFDGQACTVDGNTLAFFHATIPRLDTQFHAVVQRNRVQSPDRVYDSGKHSRRSKTNNVSEPSGRRSTTTQRGASASGNAGTPGKAGTAPSPSQIGDCTQYKRSTRPSVRSLVPSAPPPSHNNDWIPASRS